MTTEQSYQINKIKAAIKDQIKKKDLTYSDLAKELQCSLPTVNRILGDEELTLSRLLDLCKIVDIEFSDLAQLLKSTTPNTVSFSEQQNEFLVKNPSHFAYLLQLMADETPKSIATQFGLNQKSTDKYLIHLENQGLIKVSRSGKVKPIMEMPDLGSGKLARKYFSNLIDTTAHFFKAHILKGFTKQTTESATSFSTMAIDLSQETFLQFKSEQEALLKKYSDLSRLETKAKKKSDLKMAVVTLGYTLVEKDNDLIPSISNVFGKIENF